MKRKKLVVACSAFMFAIIIFLSTCLIFTVRNVTVDYSCSTEKTKEEILFEGKESLFDPMIIASRPKPNRIPTMRDFTDKEGQFYVENVYEGTHMEGVEPGSVKYLRVVESPEKRTWTDRGWFGEGEQAPGMNWHSFENKQIFA